MLDWLRLRFGWLVCAVLMDHSWRPGGWIVNHRGGVVGRNYRCERCGCES